MVVVYGVSSLREHDTCFSPRGVISSAIFRSRLSPTRQFLSNQKKSHVFFFLSSFVFAVLGVVGCVACPPMSASLRMPTLRLHSRRSLRSHPASRLTVRGRSCCVFARPPRPETLREPRRPAPVAASLRRLRSRSATLRFRRSASAARQKTPPSSEPQKTRLATPSLRGSRLRSTPLRVNLRPTATPAATRTKTLREP